MVEAVSFFARVAELADAYGSGPYGATRGGSSPLASKDRLLARAFSSCRPPGFHQLGKALSAGRSNSTFLHGRLCFCLALYPRPTSSGGCRKFGASRSRHRAAATFGSRGACTRTCQDSGTTFLQCSDLPATRDDFLYRFHSYIHIW